MKLPAIQFYPGDWHKDAGVQSLSFHDRGVWFEMLLLMHESPVRGKLLIGTKAPSDEVLARVLHIDIDVLRATVTTLLDRGICDRDSRTGALVNRRMIREETARSKNRGKLSKWRKQKKINDNCNREVTVPDSAYETALKPLPSSSSSSSSSSSIQNTPPHAREAPKSEGANGEFMAVTWLCGELGIALTGQQRRMAAQHVAFSVRESGAEGDVLLRLIVASAEEARARGEPVDDWWLAKGKWRTQGGSGGNDRQHSPAKRRINGARRKLAEIAVQRGLVAPPGGDGPSDSAVPVAGPGGIDRGVPAGLGGIGPAVLDGGNPRGAG